jgi:hypothetical protein
MKKCQKKRIYTFSFKAGCFIAETRTSKKAVNIGALHGVDEC